MNPLRYPGAKSKLFKYIKTLIAKNELNGCTFYEPFAGSATLSWQLLDEGLISQAVINEKDPLLYHFWKSVFFLIYFGRVRFFKDIKATFGSRVAFVFNRIHLLFDGVI